MLRTALVIALAAASTACLGLDSIKNLFTLADPARLDERRGSIVHRHVERIGRSARRAELQRAAVEDYVPVGESGVRRLRRDLCRRGLAGRNHDGHAR